MMSTRSSIRHTTNVRAASRIVTLLSFGRAAVAIALALQISAFAGTEIIQAVYIGYRFSSDKGVAAQQVDIVQMPTCARHFFQPIFFFFVLPGPEPFCFPNK